MRFLIFLKWILFLCALCLFLTFVGIFPDFVNDNPVVYIALFFSSLLLFLLSGILYAITLSSVGVPKNIIDVNKLISKHSVINDKDKCIVEISEIKFGIWEVKNIGNRKGEVLDMTGWVRQRTFITRLIKVVLILDSYNKSSQAAFSLTYGNQSTSYDTLYFKFIKINGKCKYVKVSEHFKIKKGLYLRLIFRFSLRGGRHIHEVNANHYKISVSDIYRIKTF